MVIIFGSRLYGKVDVVPGLFHVETKFGHLWYIPLIPLGTYLILNKQAGQWHGVSIPFSFKSLLFAWLRAGLVAAMITGIFVTIATFEVNAWVVPLILTVCAAAIFALLTFHRGSTHASYERSCQLADLVNLGPEGRKRIDEIHGYRDGVHDPFAQEGSSF
jgi:hypothetical protein